MAKILTPFQKEFLKVFGESKLKNFFIWSGGTALSFYYLQHRLSEDLDFLSQELLPGDYFISEFLEITKKMNIEKIEERKQFNRHIFWIAKKKEVLKTEFVFYPFPFIDRPKKIKKFKIKIDSLKDILTNKTHALYERVEPKDVFDIYCILKEKKISFLQIFKWVKKKFGVEIDPVFFSAKCFEAASQLKDLRPIILKKDLFSLQEIQKFFQASAEKYLKKKIK